MNRQKIITNAELKEMLGQSTLTDSLASIHNQISINVLCEILGVNDLLIHNVVREKVNILGTYNGVIEFRDFPVDLDTIVLRNWLEQEIATDAVFRADSHSDKIAYLVDSTGRPYFMAYSDNIWGSYTAGFAAEDMPEELKFACALIAGGSISQAERVGGVVSYKLGQKQVNFRNENEANMARQILDIYIGKYSPFIIAS